MALLRLSPDTTAPATHAMVVGIGAYRHLIGGSQPNPASNWALGQLSSAPASAQYFLDWLLRDFHHPDKPLATVEHLISPPNAVKDRAGQAQASEEPTMSALKKACKRWRDRAGSHPDNIALFYFCGHGVSKGGETGLLAADFDDPETGLLMDNAVHVEKTVQGMWSCQANNQCFFIDACRSKDSLLEATVTDPGRPLVDFNYNQVRGNAQPVYFATGLTDAARGASNRPSLFTRALVEALDGMAASDDEDGTFPAGKCAVHTDRLGPALRRAMQFLVRREPWLAGQDCTPTGGGSFLLHYPRQPIQLPLIIGCDPSAFHRTARFIISMDAIEVDRREAGTSDESWETRQKPGTYDIEARLADGRTGRKRMQLFPEYKEPTFKF